MSNKKYAEYIIEEIDSSLQKDDLFGACDTVAARFSGHGPAWTWEVDTLHRQPQSDEERKIADKLDEILLKLANGLFLMMPTLMNSPNSDALFNRLSQLVLCLNRLGEKAPKKLINDTFDMIGGLANADKSRAEILYSLTPFLPGVSYFH